MFKNRWCRGESREEEERTLIGNIEPDAEAIVG